VYEERVDGWRIVAYKDGDVVRLISRRGVNHSARFPELVQAVARLSGTRLVHDGEVAVLGEQRQRAWLKAKVRCEGRFLVGGHVERREG
jgi:bifunctional non-homologous end joining protein LigD